MSSYTETQNGSLTNRAAYANGDGSFDLGGLNVNDRAGGIRPAMLAAPISGTVYTKTR